MQPLIIDKPEYPAPYSVLVESIDPTDRAPSCRTKLAATTLQLCETYLCNHPDRWIYHENDRLRIYQFPARSRGSVPAPMPQ